MFAWFDASHSWNTVFKPWLLHCCVFLNGCSSYVSWYSDENCHGCLVVSLQFLPSFLQMLLCGPTQSENFHAWQPPLSLLSANPSWSTTHPPCFAQLCRDTNPISPQRTVTLALGSAQNGASLGVWHAIAHRCKQQHTYTESISSS